MNKTVLITGVGKRLGLALAHHLISQNYTVIGTYRTSYPELEQLKQQGIDLYQCDLTLVNELEKLCAQIAHKYPQLRAIVHNASAWLPDDESDPVATINQMMAIHVTAPYQMNMALSKLLINQQQTCDIIHVSDFVATKGSAKHIAYAASKAALDNLTLSFATKLAPSVKVNSIAPALVMFNDNDSEEYKQKAKAKSLMAIEGGVQEFLDTVTYLFDSNYVTGRILHLDGGRHLK
ncbi:MAG: dihydromonapterin reductase [Parashewanella sp.]